MGHDVLFLEESEDYPSCYNPETYEMSVNPDYGLHFIADLFNRFDIGNKWAYHDSHTRRWFGQSERKVRMFLARADIVLNISGINPITGWVARIPARILIDTDPAFMQIRHLTDARARKNAEGHNIFLTFGENFGKKGCLIPDDGFPWLSTRQPVVTKLWKNNTCIPEGKWTTVMQWDSYKSVVWNGQSFGMKSQSFTDFLDLPGTTEEEFEIALGSVTAPFEELREKGWLVKDSISVTKTSSSYQEFIRKSKGEWSVAKQGYVVSRSGWFSERSAVYLASGKPVIVQDTGFPDHIPTGEGLFCFKSPEDLHLIFQTVNSDYSRHCLKAAEIAHTFFGHTKILSNITGANG